MISLDILFISLLCSAAATDLKTTQLSSFGDTTGDLQLSGTTVSLSIHFNDLNNDWHLCIGADKIYFTYRNANKSMRITIPMTALLEVQHVESSYKKRESYSTCLRTTGLEIMVRLLIIFAENIFSSLARLTTEQFREQQNPNLSQAPSQPHSYSNNGPFTSNLQTKE